MALPTRRDDVDEQRLIEEHVDPDYDRYGGRADARLRDSGVSVWILVAYLRVYDGDAQKVAEIYDL